MQDHNKVVAQAIRRMLEMEKGNGSHTIIATNEREDYYVQLATNPGTNMVDVEAVSNEFLPEEQKLTQQQIVRMHELGWNDPHPHHSGNFFYAQRVASEKDIAELAHDLVLTLRDVYGLPPESELNPEVDSL